MLKKKIKVKKACQEEKVSEAKLTIRSIHPQGETTGNGRN